jgi:hypothetical protein
MEVVMLKKWPKPSFLISAELHSKIVNNCKAISLIDSRVLDVRPVKLECKKGHESKSVKSDFTCCFANH